jgi:hypothetical protein
VLAMTGAIGTRRFPRAFVRLEGRVHRYLAWRKLPVVELEITNGNYRIGFRQSAEGKPFLGLPPVP